ncbi:hypothetical protein AX16_004132 [Volvariella volvacea WC 439]|nr:hypothetical protein AX16_004132 [Volvariella volvacea WC 439]
MDRAANWIPAEGRFEALEPHVKFSALHFGDNRDTSLLYIDRTRDSLLIEIDAWAEDITSPQVFKTGLEESAPRRPILFWQGDPERTGLKNFVVTLAYDLGFILPSSAKIIRAVLDGNPSFFDAPIEEQWENLIVKPLETLNGNSMSFRPLVIIDGIDECSSRDDQLWVVAKTIELCTRFPVALILSSRPEYHLQVEMMKYQKQFPSLFRSFIQLEDNDDVQQQMRRLLYPMYCDVGKVEVDRNWVPTSLLDETFETVIADARGQLLMVEALRSYVVPYEVMPDIRNDLNRLQYDGKVQAKALHAFDKRYDSVMVSAKSFLNAEQKVLRDKIFYYLLYIQEDSVRGISVFWDTSSAEVRTVLQQYYSVVRVPSGKDAKHYISKASYSIDAFEQALYLAEHRGLHKTATAPVHLISLWLRLKPQINLSSLRSRWQSKRRIIRALDTFDFSSWLSQWYLNQKSEELEAAYKEFRGWVNKLSKSTLKKFAEDALSRAIDHTQTASQRSTLLARLFKVLSPKWIFDTSARTSN